MSDATLPLEGGCRCGQVRFKVTTAPGLTAVCHCRGCQKMTGGAFALSTMVSSDGFHVIEGEPVIGGMHGPIQHFHCPHCLSWVFTRPPGVPFVNVRTSMLDAPDGFAPFVDMWVEEKLPFVPVLSKRPYDQFPEMGEWPELMKAYAMGEE